MKISRASAYALHALMYMVRHATQLPVSCGAIARAEGIPNSYLTKVVQRSARAGYIRSVRGHRTGYVFVKPPEEIGLLEVFETIEGAPLFDVACCITANVAGRRRTAGYSQPGGGRPGISKNSLKRWT